jgi:hypothetical protein
MSRKPRKSRRRMPARTYRIKTVLDYILKKGPYVPAITAAEDLGLSLKMWKKYEQEAINMLIREAKLTEEGIQEARCKLIYALSNEYAKAKLTSDKIKISREIAKLGGLYAPEKVEVSSASSIQVHASVQRLLENTDELEKSLEQDERFLSSAPAVLLQSENDRSEPAQDPANAGADGDAVYS